MEIPFSGSESTLLGLIKELGFKWRKTEDNRKVLMESYDIRLLRIKYLKQILKYRDEGRPIFYTDESYVHTTHLPNHSWTDRSGKCVKKTVAS
ncbi:hypothetical protein MTP99_001872 [Tenebrio molitor]|nr:hypothetical protein MTP99_001872 [Tenebrio molitor]